MLTDRDASFIEVLDKLLEMHNQKGKDYGVTGDSYANVRGSKEFGVEPWMGAMIRAMDKMKRLQKYARTGTLVNESVEDSFLDLAVYTIIAYILYKEEQSEHTKDTSNNPPNRDNCITRDNSGEDRRGAPDGLHGCDDTPCSPTTSPRYIYPLESTSVRFRETCDCGT